MEQIKSKRKEKAMLVPAKLVTFIETDNNETSALIHSCWQYCKKVLVITYQWQLECANVKINKQGNIQYTENVLGTNLVPVYHKVSIDCIQKHCLILPYEENSQYVMEINNPMLWAEAFSTV